MPAACPRCRSVSPAGAARCTQCGADLLAAGTETTLANLAPSDAPHRAHGGIAVGAIVHDKYRLLEEIGRGGMGVVYKAQDLRLKRAVAIKFLSHELMQEPDARLRFVHEAQAASELDHPNICTVHEIGETDSGQMYIAMAYYEGESLKDRIARGPIAQGDAVGIAIQLARGLDVAHRHGIVHRDVKPANVLLTGDGLAKIVDFGLAKLEDVTRMTHTGTTMGTAAYMSPEQALGQSTDARADLWSLGVIFYEMLTGRRPFAGNQHASVLYAVVHERPPRPARVKPGIPAKLEQVVLRALEKKPEARYPSAGAIVRDLEAWQESARADSAPHAMRTLLRRARAPRIAIPALAVLLLAGSLGAWYFDRQSKVRWARDIALPEIERLVAENDVWRDLASAYDLAVMAEAVIPDDARLGKLLAKLSVTPSIRTEPPGARVYMKPYAAPESEWKYLGVTPLERLRLPIGTFRWKLEKDGYETVLAAASTWNVDPGKEEIIFGDALVRTLDAQGGAPAEMVRVQGATTEAGRIEDFFIDRHEVTNRQYKAFVDAGGYRERKYWRHPFTKDGKEIPWDQAIRQFVDATGQPGPATWHAGDHADGQADFPVAGVSWYEAAAYAEFAGKMLPTAQHWGIARGEFTPMIQFPQLGGDALFVPFSNFNGKGPVAAGSLAGITAFGAVDMAGNVREWCWNETAMGRCVRGGAWDDNTYMFSEQSQAPPLDRSAKNGFRCALYPDSAKVPAAALAALKLGVARDLYKEKPVADPVYAVYKAQFDYDSTPLNSRVETRQEFPGWIQEKVSFDAAYGRERVLAHLFLPKNATPPYHAVVYFPGSASAFQRSSKDIESYYEYTMFLAFVVRSGRAVLYPVYKGTFERGNAALSEIHGGANSRAYSELLAQQVKDFRRSVDYLQGRPDIDGGRIAYYGMSWGAFLGAVIPAVEERIKASVLVGAGLGGTLPTVRPEADPVNYVGRVRIPTLILNGRYDVFYPPETSAKPMLDLLGTPAAHKKLKLYATDHIPPRNEYVKETLAWLDRYLGPVR